MSCGQNHPERVNVQINTAQTQNKKNTMWDNVSKVIIDEAEEYAKATGFGDNAMSDGEDSDNGSAIDQQDWDANWEDVCREEPSPDDSVFPENWNEPSNTDMAAEEPPVPKAATSTSNKIKEAKIITYN